MAKLDIMNAFRLIPVWPAKWHQLGFCCEDQYYFDVVLPFGCRSSPYLFCQFSKGIRWIIAKEASHPDIQVHWDDFLIVAPPSSPVCAKTDATMEKKVLQLGVLLATDKTKGPPLKLTFLGIQLNSGSQNLSLPPGKFGLYAPHDCTAIR